MKTAVIVFPASNCDRDAKVALEKISGRDCLMVWHGETTLPPVDFVVVPGGFSYGDYLRSGAIAARSPIMRDVIKKANDGLPVAGFCNGFQVLTESGLLPGALMRNKGLRFVCRPQTLTITNSDSMYTKAYKDKKEITMPIAHFDGNYYADEETLGMLKKNNQIIFKYKDNPNGSVNDIAGISNAAGNVLGMMPHPERAIDNIHGGTDGLNLFKSVLEAIR
ncbi:MAG: phosphoribosylformylglycinamidine synthase subunit PurQ [Robiginitomaculum sp.]|nr:phosphoribosylformylglycinamidine synthase subunit PurQ [Robiginitomaculum sp.]